MGSWKTLAFGFLSGLMIVFAEVRTAFDDKPETNPNIPLIISGLGMMGLGGFARDNNVTSEQAGLK